MNRKAGQKPDRGGRHGSVTVPVYRTQTRTGVSWVVAWYEGSQRRRKGFADESEAIAFANRKAKEISLHGATSLALTGEQLLIVRRAIETATRHGATLDGALDDWAKAKAITGQRAVADVAKEWARSLPPSSPPVAVAVAEYLEAKDAAKRSTRHVRDLRERLGRFAEAFRCQISTVSTHTVEMWLQSLPVGPRSRRNYLGAVTGLLRFAERRGYVARGSIDLSGVERSDAGTEIAIYSPAELRTLLAGMRPDLIPFVALGAFAGLRTAEIQRLDWRDVGPEYIEIRAKNAKTRSRRLVPVLKPLEISIGPLRKPSGPLCPLVEPAHVLGPLSRKLGVPWKPNGLRHSFGSYRLALTRNEGQVALEMGNSPAMIFRHYRALVTEAQAVEWFATLPK